MIVVLCPTYQNAIQAFEMFETYLWEDFPWDPIVKIERSALLIQTDEDLTYLFIHHRFRDLFDEEKDDIIEEEEFFEYLGFAHAEHYM